MKLKTASICIVIMLLAASAAFFIHTAGADPLHQVDFINVGQGDSILLQDGSGFDVLIDGGRSAAGPIVTQYLRDHGVDTLEVMVATHADADHIGGLIDVLEANDITVGSVVYSGYAGTTATWADFVAAAANDGLTLTPLQFPSELDWGSMHVYVLNPEPGMVNPDSNDTSVVLRVAFGQTDYLFTADIDTSMEATVVARETPVAAEVLKVAHHGSAYSSSAAFLAAVAPQDAIISVGPNSYGHPSPDTIARLVAAGAKVWRTDVSGTISVIGDNASYTVHPEFELTDLYVYLTTILRSPPTDTPTPTSVPPTETPLPSATATPTRTPTITMTPTATNLPVHNTGNVQITGIFYDGAGSQEPDEYVDIQNQESFSIQLQGWTLRDAASHIYTFPNYVMQSGQVCRVYTNQNHPEWCGFNYGSGSAIWNNSGDTAYLRDGNGTLIDTYTYP
jgi:competence protein ComEC